jgi:hypothetical protein
MRRLWFFALLAFPAAGLHAQTTELELIDSAQESCTALGGEFSTSPRAVTRQDLDGDGDEDILVDESGFTCSASATLFTPLGGAQLHAIVGDRHDVWMAQAWRLIEWGDDTILLMALHGTQCHGYGYQHCYEAVTWSDGIPMSVRANPERINRSLP